MVSLNQVAETLKVDKRIIIDYLFSLGFEIKSYNNFVLTEDQYIKVTKKFSKYYSTNPELNRTSFTVTQTSILRELKEIRKNKTFEKSSHSSTEKGFERLFETFNRIMFGPTKLKAKYQLKKVALAFDTNTTTIVEILSANGYSILNKPNFKIDDEQLHLLTNYFAENVDLAISRLAENKYLAYSEEEEELLLNNADTFDDYVRSLSLSQIVVLATEEYLEKYNIDHAKRFAYIKFKINSKIKKVSFGGVKTHFHSIITPRLFHVFVSEEDNSKVANTSFSFSTIILEKFREAYLKVLNFKLSSQYEALTEIRRNN